ncbi:hypothetical protein [Enterococcus sp. AZ109]|uniref:hypothetical protein n=1 Tax=Enterococcus sp. AZ109 TaxID=2774634 RepID=UPI003F1EF417
MNFKKITYRFFSIFSIILMLWVVGTTIIIPKIGPIFGMFRAQHSPKIIIILNIGCLTLVCLLYFFLWRILKKRSSQMRLSDKNTLIILGVELLIYIISLLLFFRFIGFTNPVDDTSITLNYLDQLSANNHLGYDYMYSNPQNLFLMFIFEGIHTLFGREYSTIIVAFCLLHAITILFSFFAMRNIKICNLVSLIAIQFWIFAVQISLHVGVAYTDTLALFFVSMALFFFTKFIKENQSMNISKNLERKVNWIYLSLTLISLTLGYIGKGTVLIVILAFFVTFWISFSGRLKIISFLPIVFLILGIFGWKQIIINQNIFPDSNFGQPNTHYLMMGLSNAKKGESNPYSWAPGVYNSDDQAFTWKLFLEEKKPKTEITQTHFEIIKDRLNQLSLVEKINFVNHKVSVTWSSGDLKSTFEMILGANKEKNRMTLLYNKTSGLILYIVMMVVQYCIYVGVILSICQFFRKFDVFVLLGNIFISGYFCFLILWEASPRYAMLLFPFAIIMIAKYLQSYSLKSIVE